MAPAEGPDEECSYYEVLGVPFEASDEEIRHVYHGIVRTLHPDRRRHGAGGEALDRFHQVQSAWRCLSDPTRRLLYDLRNFARSSVSVKDLEGDGTSAEEKLVALQREQAQRDRENMEVVLQKVLRRERAANGVVVRAAYYGDLRLREECLAEGVRGGRTIVEQDLIGPVLDVAVPLQCLVEQHTIVLPGGACASKADLPGFYNPSPLDAEVELSLYVLYEFRGHQHEVIVGDRETLSLPFRKHALQPGKAPRGPFSPANIMRLRMPGARAGGGGSPGGSPAASSSEVLRRAASAYSLQRLRARDPADASGREFMAVALTALSAVAYVVNDVNEALRKGKHGWLGPLMGLGALVTAGHGLWKAWGGER